MIRRRFEASAALGCTSVGVLAALLLAAGCQAEAGDLVAPRLGDAGGPDVSAGDAAPRADAAGADAHAADAAVADAGARSDPVWTPIPADQPGVRESPAFAYDAPGERLLMFGGCALVEGGGCRFLTDLWALSLGGGLAAAQWTLVVGDREGLQPNGGSYFAGSHASSGRVVVVGTDPVEVWNLESASPGAPRWVPVARGGAVPSPRFMPAFSYDPERDQAIVYGGQSSRDFLPLDDVWLLEHASGAEGPPTWRALRLMAPAPPPRTQARTVPVRRSSGVFVLGGQTGAAASLQDGWRLTLSGDEVRSELLFDSLPEFHTSAGFHHPSETLVFPMCGAFDGLGCSFDRVGRYQIPGRQWSMVPIAHPDGLPRTEYDPRHAYYVPERDQFFWMGPPEPRLWVLSNVSGE